jgi:hypothetical protein
MTRTLELALAKAAELPEAAQDALGLDLLDRIAALAKLRADLQVGIDDLDAGRSREIDFEELLEELHREHAVG